MTANTDPIFSKAGAIDGGEILLTGAADYTGQGVNNLVLFTADANNGGFVQRIRLKPLGTNIATVARFFINNGQSRLASQVATPGQPTGTPSTTGGTLQAGTFFAKIVAVDQFGGMTPAGTESASNTVTGTTASIAWAWTAVTGAVSYRVYIGPVTGGQNTYFTTATNAFTQTTAVGVRDSIGNVSNNNIFYGEVSLPATTQSSNTALPDIDYPMNIALPAGYRIIGAVETTVATGWMATVIAGAY